MDTFNTKIKSKQFNKKETKMMLKWKYWTIALGVCLVFCGYASFLVLQSSIRIEEGLGTKLTAATYLLQFGICFVLGPFILRFFGAKKALIASEIGYLFYVVTNIFSNKTLLIISSIVAALSNGIFWLPLGISFVYFAKKYSRMSSKSEEDCIMEFSGMLLGIFQLNYLLGNAFSAVILSAFQNMNTTSNSNNNSPNRSSPLFEISFLNESSSTVLPNISQFATSSYSHLMYCGANDCQNPNVTQENIDQYVPKNPVAVYVLTGCLILLMAIGILIHLIFLPDMPLGLLNKQKSCDPTDIASFDTQEVGLGCTKNVKGVLKMSFQSVKDTIATFFHPRQLIFITPLAIYLGLQTGFAMSEATRAYASCVLGVSQVGVCIILYAGCNSTFTYFIGRVLGRYGRVVLLTTGVTLDCVLYTFCLLWKPVEETTCVVYVLFCLLGVSNSIWEILAATVFASDFFKTKEVSFNIWNITFATGFGLQFSISTLMCVRSKLYIMIGWTVVASTLDGINTFLENRKNKIQIERKSDQITFS